MYAVFKDVPKQVRQEAYRLFVESEPDDAAHPYWRNVDGATYCPLGLVSRALIGGHPVWTTPIVADDLAWDAANSDVERFIFANDGGEFDTPEKLARAMGVEVME